MAATALIKFTQGPNTDVAGRAVLGTPFAVDGSVTITNDDATDIDHWKLYLVNAPPGSTLELATVGDWTLLAEASDNIPVATFDPDIEGSYRILLQVWDASNTLNQDIRNFIIPDEGGFVLAPFQKLPDPLSLPDPVSPNELQKPNEMNVGGQPYGWMGNPTSGMMHHLVKHVANLVKSPEAGDADKVSVVTGADAVAYQLLVNANLSASANIDVTKMAAGSTDEILRMAGGSVGWGKIVDANVDASAALAVSKLAAGADDQVIKTTGGVVAWGTGGGSGLPDYTTTEDGDVIAIDYPTTGLVEAAIVNTDGVDFWIGSGASGDPGQNLNSYVKGSVSSAVITEVGSQWFSTYGTRAVVYESDSDLRYALRYYEDGTSYLCQLTSVSPAGHVYDHKLSNNGLMIEAGGDYVWSVHRNLSTGCLFRITVPEPYSAEKVTLGPLGFYEDFRGYIRWDDTSSRLYVLENDYGLFKIQADKTVDNYHSPYAPSGTNEDFRGLDVGDGKVWFTHYYEDSSAYRLHGVDIDLATDPVNIVYDSWLEDAYDVAYETSTDDLFVLGVDPSTLEMKIVKFSWNGTALSYDSDVTFTGYRASTWGSPYPHLRAFSNYLWFCNPSPTSGEVYVFRVDPADLSFITLDVERTPEWGQPALPDSPYYLESTADEALTLSAYADTNLNFPIIVNTDGVDFWVGSGSDGDHVYEKGYSRGATAESSIYESQYFLEDGKGTLAIVYEPTNNWMVFLRKNDSNVGYLVAYSRENPARQESGEDSVGSDPTMIEAGGDYVWLNLLNYSGVYRVDPDDMEFPETVPFDAGGFYEDMRGYMRWDSTAARLFVAENDVGLFKVQADKTVDNYGSPYAPADANGSFRGLDVGDGKVWFTYDYEDGGAEDGIRLAGIDTDLSSNYVDLPEVLTYMPFGGEVCDVAYSPVTKDIYVYARDADEGEPVVLRIGWDKATLVYKSRVVLTGEWVDIDTPPFPHIRAFDGYLWIANGTASTSTPAGAVWRIDPEDLSVVQVEGKKTPDWVAVGGAGSDTTAIHDNVAGEIAAITNKATPVSGDYLLIEDSADSNNKKHVLVSSLPSGGAGSDTTAIHDNVAGEIAAITNKATPASGDYLLIEDSADSNNKKHVLVSSLSGGGVDRIGRGAETGIQRRQLSAIGAAAQQVVVSSFRTGNQSAADDPVSGPVLLGDKAYFCLQAGGASDYGSIASVMATGSHLGTEAIVDRYDFPALADPRDLVSDGYYLFSANYDAGTVTKLSASLAFQSTLTVGNQPRFMLYDGENIIVLCQNAVYKIDPSDTVTSLAGTGNGLTGGVFDGRYVWICDPQWDYVWKLDTLSAGAPTVVSTFTNLGGDIPTNPYYLTFDGSYVWMSHDATSTSANSLTRIDVLTDAVETITIGTVSGQNLRNHVLFDGQYLWVELYSTSTFSTFILVDPTTGNRVGYPTDTGGIFRVQDGRGFVVVSEGVVLATAGTQIMFLGRNHGTGIVYPTDIETPRGPILVGQAEDVPLTSSQVYYMGTGDSAGRRIVRFTGTQTGATVRLTNFDVHVIHNNTTSSLDVTNSSGTGLYTMSSGDIEMFYVDPSGSPDEVRLVGGLDSNAIHDNVAGEINGVSEEASPQPDDILLLEDSGSSYVKKKVKISSLPNGGAGTDTTAIHDNVSAEISVITEKTAVVGDDLLVIEDSGASNAKKRVKAVNLPARLGYGAETGIQRRGLRPPGAVGQRITFASFNTGNHSTSDDPVSGATWGGDKIYACLQQGGGSNYGSIISMMADGYSLGSSAIVDRYDFPALADPRDVLFNGYWVWSANYDAGTVTKLTAALSFSSTLTVGTNPRFLLHDGTNIIVICQAAIYKIDPSDTVTSLTSGLGTTLYGAVFDGRYVWVVDQTNTDVHKIDTLSAGAPTIVTTVGVDSLAYYITFDGSYVWVTHGVSSTSANSLTRIDVVRETAENIAVGTVGSQNINPHIAFDGRYLWVELYVSPGSSTVCFVDPTTGQPLGYPTSGVTYFNSPNSRGWEVLDEGVVLSSGYDSISLLSRRYGTGVQYANAIHTQHGQVLTGQASNVALTNGQTYYLGTEDTAGRGIVRFSGTLTLTTTVRLGDIGNSYVIYNDTSNTLTLSNISGTGTLTISSGSVGTYYVDAYAAPAQVRQTGSGTAGGPGTDTTAIHDNVAAEISGVSEKGTPVGTDLLLIEDSADSNNKKKVQIANLPGGSGSGDVVGPASATDHAIARFDTTTGKLIQDSVFIVDDSGNVTGAGTFNGETVANLVHDDVAGEFAAITVKGTPVSGDLLLIEDSADLNNKKYITIGTLPGGGGSGDVVGPTSATDHAIARFDTTTGKLIQDSVFIVDDSGNVTGAGTFNGETVANLVHDNVAGEFAAITVKGTPVSGDLLLIEDSADINKKKYITIGTLPGGGGSGDVVGPASATDNAIARFDTTTGKLLQNSTFIVDDSGNVTGGGTFNGETVANLVHDDVAGEFAAITVKGTPVSGDLLLIEDSADINKKKYITIGTLPTGPAGDVVGPASATDNAIARFDTTTGKLIQNSTFIVDDSGNVTGGGTFNGETVANLIHDNVAGEIAAITVKGTPVGADYLVIEDSADTNKKKHVLISSLPVGSLTVDFVSPAQITSNQDDYSPTGWSTANVVRLNTDASRNITGLSGSPTAVRKTLINVGSYNIVLQHQNTGSVAANRVIVPGASDLTLQPDDVVNVIYDPTTTRWRVA